MEHPASVGVSLSGGGLRAASFGFGCLQELDARWGVLSGPRAADYLSAVSGGSYTAAAVSVYVATRGDDPSMENVQTRALAPGSPDAGFLAEHCDYFLRDGLRPLARDILKLVAFGLVALGATLLWLPAMLCSLALTASSWSSCFVPQSRAMLVVAGTAGLALYAFVALWSVRGNPKERRHPYLFLWPWAIGLTVIAPATVALIRTSDFLFSPRWWLSHAPEVLASLFVALIATGFWSWIHWPQSDAVRTGRRVMLAAILKVLYRTLQLASALVAFFFVRYVRLDPAANSSVFWISGLIIIGILVVTGWVLFYGASDAVSPHHFYAMKVASCFGLIYPLDHGIAPEDIIRFPLSKLRQKPDVTLDERRPELLICAAANIKSPNSPVSSIVFSPTRTTLYKPDDPSYLDTDLYERFTFTNRQRLHDQQPALTLFRAVGLSGAAVAPSMGYKTVQAAVSILALLNVRLGRWMPNPGSGYIQQSAREDGGHHLGVGAREALREFWGHHPADSDLLYVSDGAHYENLGIVELLRRQCRVIIAVDSSGGRVGAAGALEHSLRLARAELGLEIDIDMSPFMQSETDRNMIRRCWSLGSVTYSDGSRASVLVVRIGTDSQTPPSVVECGRAIRKFPHTSTLNQFYNVQSFQAYVELGRSSMATALRSGEVQAVLGSVPKR